MTEKTAPSSPASEDGGLAAREAAGANPAGAARPPGPDEPGMLVMMLLATIGFVVSGILRITDALLPPIAAEFGVSIGDAAVVIAAFGTGFGLFTFVYGGLGDWLGKLKVISIAGLGAAVATWLCANATDLWGLAAFRFLTGATVCACIPLSLAYIGDNVSYGRRQAVLGRYLSGVMLGQVLGTAVSGIITDLLGWRHVFHIYGVAMGVVAGVLAWMVFSGMVRRRARDRSPLKLSNYKEILTERKSLHFYALCTAEGMIVLGAIAFISAMMRDRFELSYAVIGMILAGYGLGGLVYSALVKALVNRLSEVRLVMLGGSGVAAMFAMLALAPASWMLFPIMAVMGFSFYTFHVVLQARATEISQSARGAALAFFSFTLFLGQSLGALAFGQIVDRFTYTHCFLAAAAAMLLLAGQIAWGLKSGALIKVAPGVRPGRPATGLNRQERGP